MNVYGRIYRMSMTFTKLFSSITASTLWAEPDHTRLVWITMLAMADQHGRVWASIPGLANMARVTIEKCEEALATLSGPDKYSRTKEHDGRRVEEIDGGWRLLNHGKYRAIRDEESIKESKRRWAANNRATKKVEQAVEESRTESNAVDRVRANTEADTEAELKDIAPTVLVGGADAYRVPDCPYQELVALYHEECPAMPRVLVMSSMRQKNLMARWRQVCAEDKMDKTTALDWFRWYFQQASSSKFLSGRAGGKGDRAWKADFEWLINGSNFAKVVEGRYSNERSAI